jgi:hypothetical protein
MVNIMKTMKILTVIALLFWAVNGWAQPSAIPASDEAYNATTWDGVTSVPPSKNAVRDKIEAMGSGDVTGVLGDGSGDVPYLFQTWTAFSALDATPNIMAAQHFVTADTTTYTGFDDGGDSSTIREGQWLDILCLHAAVFDFTSTTLYSPYGVDYTCAAGEVMSFRYDFTNSKWGWQNPRPTTATFAPANPIATDTLWDASGDLVQGTGANTAAKLTKGAEGTILRAGAASNAYSTSTFADTYLKGTFLYAATANTIAGLAHPGAANYFLMTDAADTAAWTLGTNLGAINGLTFADASLVQLTGAGTAAVLTSGGNSYFLKSATDNSGLMFATPAEVKTALGYYTSGDSPTFAAVTVSKVSGVAGLSSFYEANSTDTSYIGWMGPASIAESHAYQLSSTQPSAGQAMVFAAPTGTGDPNGNKVSAQTWVTPATLTGTETLINKTLTAPLVTLPRVAGGAADLSLSAAQVSGTIITNAGQGVVDRNHTLPAAAEGYNFVGFVGTAVAATNYYRFTAATAATMCLDGTCGKAYVTIDTPTQGASVVCYTEQVSSTGMSTATALSAATATDDVKNTAATIDIAGQVYAVAATDGTAPGDDVIVAAKWGAVAFDVGVNGTIDAVEETGQAADQHADEAAAIAALAAQNPEAAHVRIGYVTASKSDGTFTFGTDALVTAGTTTANFYNTAAYTKPFNWICTTGAGTWVTD